LDGAIVVAVASPVPTGVKRSDDGPASEDGDIIIEALERFKAVEEWQGVEDERSRSDTKFANGDARNTWQWDRSAYNRRTGGDDSIPCLTINNTRVHNDMVINDMTKSSFEPKVRPVGGRASYKSAKMMETLVRRTLNISNFSAHRRKVAEQQVDGGIGYMLIETDWVSPKSMDQDIFLRAARDPTGVYLDRWIKEPDGSDARFGFVFDKMARQEFNRRYPKWKDRVGQNPLGTDLVDTWLSDKEIVVAKYFRKKEIEDRLVSYDDEDGNTVNKFRSDLVKESGPEIYKALIDDIKEGRINGRTRSVTNDEVEWFLIAGDTIIDRDKWAGKYIPICRCVGRELVIENTLDRKGLTRPQIDANRMLNYAASVSVQVGALAPKAQWIGPARAFEGQEQWKDANVKTYAALMYNDIDEEANGAAQVIPPPQRVDPPQVSPASVQTMQAAERWGMMVTGQFQAQMGENDTQSAASGKAIGQRKAQGDTATYHFPDNMMGMYRFIGVQLLDLYPKIYDTKRALHVIGEDGEKSWLQIDPTQEGAVEELKDLKDDEEAAELSFNPNIGEYEVVSDPGPSYATQRQEAWDAISMILQQNSELAATCADLLFKYGDFPGAEDLAERLQKEIRANKPYLFDDGAPTPQVAHLTQLNQKLQGLAVELQQKLAAKELALKGKDEKRDVDASRAESDRIRALTDAIAKIHLTPAQKAQFEHEMMMASHTAGLGMIDKANQADIDFQAQGADHAHELEMQANAPTPSAGQ
jgi:Phage P22-like portal protein